MFRVEDRTDDPVPCRYNVRSSLKDRSPISNAQARLLNNLLSCFPHERTLVGVGHVP